MRQTHRAGEKLFADFAGPTVPIIDAETGELRPTSPGRLAGRAGTGVSVHRRRHRPDRAGNPKALVTVANPYEPELNRATAEFAERYGTVILPARPKKPQDKAKVESCVQVVERWILARLRYRQFFSVAELDAAVAELLPVLRKTATS